MFIREHTESVVKIGPVLNRDGTAFNRKRLNHKEVYITDSRGVLEPISSEAELRVDQDGFYDVTVPGSHAGSLTVVLFIDGLSPHSFEHTVLSVRAYSAMFTNDTQESIATNVPVRNGHVVTDPNLIVGIDLERIKNKAAELDLNMSISSVGIVKRPHVTDLTRVLETIKGEGVNSSSFQERVEEIKACIADTDPAILKVQLLAIITGLKAISDQIEVSKVTVADIGADTRQSISGLAKKDDIAKLSVALESLEKMVCELDFPTAEDFADEIPLETKDGKVRVVCGTGEGEIDLKNGQVLASDVENKAGYMLNKDGIGRIKADICNVIREEFQKLQPPSQRGRKVAARSAH